MFLIYGDDNKNRSTEPVAVYLLIALNCAVYALQLSDWDRVTGRLSVVPYEVVTGKDLVGEIAVEFEGKQETMVHYPALVSPYFTLLTAVFVHGSLMHLLGNMLYLWIFGDQLEDWLGSIRFLGFYLLVGVVANLGFSIFHGTYLGYLLGASGAISGVLGGYLLLYPKNTVSLIFFYRAYQWPASVVLAIWFALQIVGQIFSAGHVAYLAHIGGFAVGIVALGIYNSARGLWSEVRLPTAATLPMPSSPGKKAKLRKPRKKSA